MFRSTIDLLVAVAIVLLTVIYVLKRIYLTQAHKMKRVHVAEIFIYPIKSCKGIRLTKSQVDTYGFLYDRHFMVVKEENNQFVSQRHNPKLALLERTIDWNKKRLTLNAPRMKSITLPLDGKPNGKVLQVGIWSDECTATDQGDEVAEWLSEYLDASTRLVRIAPNFDRRVLPEYQVNDPRAHNLTTFTNSFPFLLVSNASLAGLNQRLAQPVPMDRFRPNIVVDGGEAANMPFSEDLWKQVKIGSVTFEVVESCPRCRQTTVDQSKGVFDTSEEPLKTLSTFRNLGTDRNPKIMFGVILVHTSNGAVQTGDEVIVLERKTNTEK